MHGALGPGGSCCSASPSRCSPDARGGTTGATQVQDTSAHLNARGSCDSACSAYVRWRKVGTSAWSQATPITTSTPVQDVDWGQAATGLTAATTVRVPGVREGVGGGSGLRVRGARRHRLDADADVHNSGGSFAVCRPGSRNRPSSKGSTIADAVRVSPDGRVFVAEKSGLSRSSTASTDTTPTVFADLARRCTTSGTAACSAWRSHPNFPTDPYVYVLYTLRRADRRHRAALGNARAICPTPPGPDGRRLRGQRAALAAARANGNVMTGTEQVLIDDWCQQYPSHSVGGPGVRRRRRALRERRRRRELQLRRLRPARTRSTRAATRRAASERR